MKHLHIMGAPGAGVSTLGRTVAQQMGWAHFDTDDYEWFTDDPLPYRRKRNTEHRRTLLAQDLTTSEPWVLSGSLCGWGDVFVPQFELVVYCWLPADIRLARIREREMGRYGADRLQLGGDLQVVFEEFLTWAGEYDTATERWRSREKESEWLAGLPCQVLHLKAEGDWVRAVLQAVSE